MKQQNSLNTPFIRKLNHILQDPEYSLIINWDPTGTMIDILDEKKMQTQVLPRFFRHSKFQSFIRQLNLYGFKKIKKSECHRFRHADLIKKSSLFSIKSQRKNRSIIKSSIEKIQNFNNESQNLQNEFKLNKNSQKELTEQFEKNELNLKNNNLDKLNSMNWFYNASILYQNQIQLQQMTYNQLYCSLLYSNNQQKLALNLFNNGQQQVLNPNQYINQNNLYYYN